MKHTLILGNYSTVLYHPFTGIDRALRETLVHDFSVTTTENRSRLTLSSLTHYDLFISYADDWETPLEDDQIAGLLAFIATGGGMLVIHNGISFQKKPEFLQLVGGQFKDHPPRKKLAYTYTHPTHPLTEGLLPFHLYEELYKFSFSPFIELSIILESEGYPAGWVRPFAKGRVVYLSPGHDNEAFSNPTYRELIRRSALWAAGVL
jgi:type 1 glutamine amidotransferase